MRAVMEVAQDTDFSVTLTEEDFANNMDFLPTSPKLWAGPKDPLPLAETKMPQCKSGELFRVATVSSPDICARLARMASRVNLLPGSDVYRVNDLVRAVEVRQGATVLTYASSSRLRKGLGFAEKPKDDLCHRGGKPLCGPLS